VAERDLFKMALGLGEPWTVTRAAFDEGEGRLDVWLDFPRGSRFGRPVEGCAQAECPVDDAEDKQWRRLDFFQHQAYLHARVPRVRCPEHGARQVALSWARRSRAARLPGDWECAQGAGRQACFPVQVVEADRGS
jgi:transposase